MKIKKLRPMALVALGVFLGRAAQADTTFVFNQPLPDGEINNPNGSPGITQAFGDYAAATSPGLTVAGFGTPNIGLGWSATGPDTRWEYYNDELSFNVWSAAQLNGSSMGSSHKITFAPNSASASAVIKSFNLHGYYNSTERFTYNVSVTSGTNVLFSLAQATFLSDATKNHPVSINYTGAPGQTLKLRIDRVASTLGAGEVEGDQYNIAVDDIKFAQLPETVFPAGPQVVSVTPADDLAGVPAVACPPYLASITNGVTTLVASSIQLKLDGSLVSPPPTISSAGGLTNVSYPGTTSLLASGAHLYTLTYADNLGAFYTNEVQFSANYTTLPTNYALRPGAGVIRGFTHRTVAARVDTPALAGTIARAKAQLAGTLFDAGTGANYTNAATVGPNADGSFNVDTVLNFNDNGTTAGNFVDDTEFPGLDFPPYDWFSTEALLYLELPAGYYRFGVNSDDGFEVSAVPPQSVSGPPVMLGLFDNGRGASDTLFDVWVQTSGLYPFRVVYFDNTGNASCEFFSVTNLATGDRALINDADPNAIKSFRLLAPHITSIVKSGSNAVIGWTYGTPPFQVQFKTNVTDAVWNNIGSPTSNRTATVPIQSATGFIRIRYTEP